MYFSHDIKTVHLEISSLCNARCPMCLRNISGGKTNPLLPLKDLKIDEIKKIFSSEFLQQLKRIYLCGNYGDPIMARDTLLALDYFRRENPNLKLEIFSNGSARNEVWWKNLAALKVEAHFGIDGIGATNAIYRRNTNFDLVMKNAQIFIEHGGIAHWDFIVFRHNEQEIDLAKSLSEKMGFKSFRTKKTGRFFSNQKGHVKNRQEVLNENGDIEYFLEAPLNSEFFNPSLQKEKQISEANGSFELYLDKTEISCKVEKEKSIFVSAEGLVFPCCWTAIQLYPWYSKPQSTQIWELLGLLPHKKDSLSALLHPMEKIVNGEFFQKIVPESWVKSSVKEGKLKVCSRICGKDFDPFRDQFAPAK